MSFPDPFLASATSLSLKRLAREWGAELGRDAPELLALLHALVVHREFDTVVLPDGTTGPGLVLFDPQSLAGPILGWADIALMIEGDPMTPTHLADAKRVRLSMDLIDYFELRTSHVLCLRKEAVWALARKLGLNEPSFWPRPRVSSKAIDGEGQRRLEEWAQANAGSLGVTKEAAKAQWRGFGMPIMAFDFAWKKLPDALRRARGKHGPRVHH